MSDNQLYFDLLADRDLTALRRVLEVEPGAADVRDANGVSLLMHAIYRGPGDLAAFIADKKVTLDIFEAAALGRLDRLRELVRDPAAINCRSADGFTALHFACFFNQPESAFVLIQSGATVDAIAANPTKVMPLHSAASVRNLEAARLLLVHGAPPNARQQGGWAPIHAAAQNGDRAMVELLLRHGADPKQANDAGETAAAGCPRKGTQRNRRFAGK